MCPRNAGPMITKLVILIMSATLGRCGPAPAPATAADEAEAATAAPAVVLALADPPPRVIHADPETADDLLARLERSASDLRDFQAGVTYWKWDSVLERDEIRQGEVVYQVDPVTGTKRFAILLERLIVGNRARTLRKHPRGSMVDVTMSSQPSLSRSSTMTPPHRLNVSTPRRVAISGNLLMS